MEESMPSDCRRAALSPEGIASLATNEEWHRAPRPRRSRDIALRRALAIIASWAEESLSIRALCRAAGASERSLQIAFHETFGLSPRQFINAYRLNSVRSALLAADPDRDRVGDLAAKMGYWHSGQFAADYRRQFGELPSDTLKRWTVSDA